MKTLTPTIDQLRMLASIKGEAWAIREDKVMQFALSALDVPAKCELEIGMEDFFNVRNQLAIDSEGIAHIEIKGALMAESPPIYEKLGLATKYSTIISETESAVSSGAKGIVYHVNSRGGTVSGNAEAASAIANAGIPTVAACDVMACSAAYKLACACDAVIATQSAEMGNVGTIMSWGDCTEFWREIGIEWKAMTNAGADLKSTFHLEPNPTQLAFLQERLDEHGAEFRQWVEDNRPNISAEVFRAGWYSGKKAGELGLIDQIGTDKDAKAWLLSKVAA